MKFLCLALLLFLVYCQTNIINWKDVGGLVVSTDNMGTCRASWAFATTAIYQSAVIKWSSNYTNLTLNLAEQYLLECSQAGDCSGGSVSTALTFALANGIPLQTNYAYAASTTLYGIPLTTTVGASCSTVTNELIKVNQTLYLNNFTNLAFWQLQNLLNNFPAVGLLAADTNFSNYGGTLYPFNCTYNFTANVQLTEAVMMYGYDNSSNILIEASGLPTWGGSSYNTTIYAGVGFGKISPINSYCGIMRHVYQYWTSINNTNTTTAYYTFGWWLSGVATGAVMMLLMTF